MRRKTFISHILFLAAWVALICYMMFCAGCAPSAAKYRYRLADGREGYVEIPQDLNAERVTIKTSSGAVIKADRISTTFRPDQTRAEGEKASAITRAIGGAAGEVAGQAGRVMMGLPPK
jgi:hypothetical protein